MSNDVKFSYSKTEMVQFAQAFAKYNYRVCGFDKEHEVLGTLIHFISDHYECQARALRDSQTTENPPESKSVGDAALKRGKG